MYFQWQNFSHREHHAVVLLHSTAAPEEGNHEDDHTDDDEDDRGREDLMRHKLEVLLVASLDHGANDEDDEARELQAEYTTTQAQSVNQFSQFAILNNR